jgi:hypothetical protein
VVIAAACGPFAPAAAPAVPTDWPQSNHDLANTRLASGSRISSANVHQLGVASNRDGRRSLILNAPGIVAVITFVAPFVLGFIGVTGIAWSAWVLAVATELVGASLRLGHRSRMTIA